MLFTYIIIQGIKRVLSVTMMAKPRSIVKNHL